MREARRRRPVRSVSLTALVAAVGLAAAACGGDEARSADAARTSSGEVQASTSEDGAQEAGGFPSGWRVRTDRGETSPEAVDLVATEGGVRVRPGPRAVYWDPETTATGTYRARATFHRLNDPGPEAYGLFVGGRDLQAEGQDYLYFLVRGDGSYLVKHRAGAETHTLVEWTEHSAVRGGSASGGAVTNTLAVESGPDTVRFLVNGTEVERLERAPMLNSDGQVGVRVNHRLDVRIEGPGVEPLEGTDAGGGGSSESG